MWSTKFHNKLRCNIYILLIMRAIHYTIHEATGMACFIMSLLIELLHTETPVSSHMHIQSCLHIKNEV